ncbi:amidohydrolase family protein [Veillonella intestinalis]|uniref:amidohydrolase family protein n=1 Tax=Veillonella intestinalis TaxID=2941341 RepID=UPI00203BAB88|nr:amidohydrolase family protein [Veillonella intestinalis]
MKVDTHAHVFSPDLQLANDRRYAPSYEASIEDFIANFESKGLQAGMLIQPSFLGFDNSYMVEAIKKYPNKLYGVAVVNTDITLKELEELAKYNIVGIRLNLYAREIPNLREGEWPRILNYVKQLGWHVELHIDAIQLQPLIDALLEAGVKVVVDHFGKPTADIAAEDEGFKYLLSVGKTGQVWVKISASYRLKKEKTLEDNVAIAKTLIPKLLEAFGPSRLLWGSDWPHTQFETSITYDKAWHVLSELVPDKATQEIILSQSFAELIGK